MGFDGTVAKFKAKKKKTRKDLCELKISVVWRKTDAKEELIQ